MKQILYILSFTLFLSAGSFAQDGDGGNGEKIREKMTEYIQKRLNLSKSEAENFQPLFMQYFNELRRTNQQFKGDRLVLQQKIIDLRLRYRDQFKPIMGEKRSNDVFLYEKNFIEELKDLRQERMQHNRPSKRLNGPLQ